MRNRLHVMSMSSLLAILLAAPAYANNVTDLSEAVEQLSSRDYIEVTHALDVMGRVCNESCVPYVMDMLHHHQMEIVTAACKTAKKLANPAFAPALLELARNHPGEAVRFEAIDALTSLGVAYDALLLNVNPENPDEFQRRIVYSLPEKLCAENAALFAHFASSHALASSVARAYRNAPELLYPELMRQIPSATRDEKHNILRTMLLLAENAGSAAISESLATLFNDDPTDELALISLIQAERSTPDAIRFLLAWASKMEEWTLLDVFSRLKSPADEMFADALMRSHDDSIQRMIHHQERIKNEMIARMPPSEMAKKLAMASFKKDGYQLSALRHLARYPDMDAFILSELGSSDQLIALQAMHILANRKESGSQLAKIAIENSVTDGFGRVYLARWGLVIWLAQFDRNEISAPELELVKQMADEVASNPRLLHAEPALWLSWLLGGHPQPASLADFQKNRADIRRAWIRMLDTKTALPYLRIALEDDNESVVAEALRYLIDHPDMANLLENLDEKLISLVQSDSAMLSTQAAVACSALDRISCIPVLENNLVSMDTRVAYNALWALQKLHALPNQYLLRSLYYRAPEGVLRDRLGFLTGLDPDAAEFMPMSELGSMTPVKNGQIIQITTHDVSASAREITVILDDQSLRLYQTNSFGLLML